MVTFSVVFVSRKRKGGSNFNFWSGWEFYSEDGNIEFGVKCNWELNEGIVVPKAIVDCHILKIQDQIPCDAAHQLCNRIWLILKKKMRYFDGFFLFLF